MPQNKCLLCHIGEDDRNRQSFGTNIGPKFAHHLLPYKTSLMALEWPLKYLYTTIIIAMAESKVSLFLSLLFLWKVHCYDSKACHFRQKIELQLVLSWISGGKLMPLGKPNEGHIHVCGIKPQPDDICWVHSQCCWGKKTLYFELPYTQLAGIYMAFPTVLLQSW